VERRSASPVIVFGREDSKDTRAALRYFKERRIDVQFSDLRRRPMAAGELRRFLDRLGAAALADRDGRAWREGGLGYLRMTDAELGGRLLADQSLLRLPLVRRANAFAVGPDEAAWGAIVAAG
jgi:arsenate reductase-like glutaredoxin family protein